MILYFSSSVYINSATDNIGRLAKVKAIIDALYAVALTAAADENITEYILDDGQTKIQCNYRGVDAITRSILSFEKIQQMLMNQINGRIFRVQDTKSFGNNNFNNGRY
jgi:hypothetical protein